MNEEILKMHVQIHMPTSLGIAKKRIWSIGILFEVSLWDRGKIWLLKMPWFNLRGIYYACEHVYLPVSTFLTVAKKLCSTSWVPEVEDRKRRWAPYGRSYLRPGRMRGRRCTCLYVLCMCLLAGLWGLLEEPGSHLLGRSVCGVMVDPWRKEDSQRSKTYLDLTSRTRCNWFTMAKSEIECSVIWTWLEFLCLALWPKRLGCRIYELSCVVCCRVF